MAATNQPPRPDSDTEIEESYDDEYDDYDYDDDYDDEYDDYDYDD